MLRILLAATGSVWGIQILPSTMPMPTGGTNDGQKDPVQVRSSRETNVIDNSPSYGQYIDQRSDSRHDEDNQESVSHVRTDDGWMDEGSLQPFPMEDGWENGPRYFDRSDSLQIQGEGGNPDSMPEINWLTAKCKRECEFLKKHGYNEWKKRWYGGANEEPGELCRRALGPWAPFLHSCHK